MKKTEKNKTYTEIMRKAYIEIIKHKNLNDILKTEEEKAIAIGNVLLAIGIVKDYISNDVEWSNMEDYYISLNTMTTLQKLEDYILHH